MFRTLVFGVAVVALSLVATPVSSTHFCQGNGVVTAIGAEPHVIYVAGPDHFLLWYHFYVYSEANGVAGLQRGGPSVLTGDFDVCQDSASPDAFVAFA